LARKRCFQGILQLPTAPEHFELLTGKRALTVYTFGTGVAQQHLLLALRDARAFYVPRSHRTGLP
jgi:hypothetical protein